MTKISQLSSIGDSLAIDDQFLIRDVDDGTTPNKSVTVSGITRALPLGSATAPALAFASDKNTGLFSPGADQVSVATNGVERLRVNATGQVGAVSLGTDAAPAYSFTGDPNTGIYSPGADQVAISTNGTGRLFVDANGNVGVGATPLLAHQLTVNGSNLARICLQTTGLGQTTTDGFALEIDSSGTYFTNRENTPSIFYTNNTERMRLTSAGLLGLGTSSPSYRLTVSGASADAIPPVGLFTGGFTSPITSFTARAGLEFIAYQSAANPLFTKTSAIVANSDGTVPSELQFWTKTNGGSSPAERLRITSAGNVGIGTTSPGSALEINAAAATSPFIAKINTAEAARIDSSGRVLIGTSTARQNWFNGTSLAPQVQIEGAGLGARLSIVRNDASANGHGLILGKIRGSSYEIVNAEDPVGYVSFQGADGAELVEAARIETVIDGTPGANDMPGRLVFSTTADGATSPTERLRITNAGVLQVADAGNISVGTTTGTKIGTATTQKLGFYNATPVVQPTAVADATDAASVITQLNALLTRMRNLGLIAT